MKGTGAERQKQSVFTHFVIGSRLHALLLVEDESVFDGIANGTSGFGHTSAMDLLDESPVDNALNANDPLQPASQPSQASQPTAAL